MLVLCKSKCAVFTRKKGFMKFELQQMKGKWLASLFLAILFNLCGGSIIFATAATKLEGTVIGRAFKDTVFLELDVIDEVEALILAQPIREGAFSFDIPCSEPRLATLRCKGQWIRFLLEPEDQLKCTFQTDDLTASFQWQGPNVDSKTLVTDFYRRFEDESKDSIMMMARKAANVDECEYLLFASRRVKREFCSKHTDYKALTPATRKFMTTQIEAAYKSYLLDFSFSQSSVTAAKTLLPLPQIMTESWDRLTFDDSTALTAPEFRTFLRKFIYYKSLQVNNYNYFADTTVSIIRQNAFAASVLKGKIYAWWLADILHGQCQNARPDAVRIMLQALQDMDPPKKLWSYANAKCGPVSTQKVKPIAKPKKSKESQTNTETDDGVQLMDLNGKAVHLNDFKGKVVYVDCWASWCGPCRGQFPFSKKLHEQFSGADLKKIVFLYISIDENEAAWRKAVDQNQLQGVQLRSPGGWNSTLCKKFGIQSIPRYMIINKKGEVINPDAPRPSEEGIYDELMKLIKQ